MKIGDFGLSVLFDKDSDAQETTLSDGPNSFVGTGYYDAPEVRDSQGACYNEKCDVYSLGVVLFEMLCPPFSTYSEKDQTFKKFLSIENLSKKDLVFPFNFRDDLNKHFLHNGNLLPNMLHFKPEERPSVIELKYRRYVGYIKIKTFQQKISFKAYGH